MEGWKDGRMEGWKGGGMEGWRDGGMEGWRDRRIEGWRDGGMEGWRDVILVIRRLNLIGSSKRYPLDCVVTVVCNKARVRRLVYNYRMRVCKTTLLSSSISSHCSPRSREGLHSILL